MTTAQLDVTGMTCASCVARVEKRLNAIDGVHATVNLATQTATVVADTPVPDSDLVAAVESAGYSATVRGTSAPAGGHSHDMDAADLTRRLLVSAPLAVLVLVIAMTPLSDRGFAGWTELVLATPVALWGG